jgi:hypothetical protein
MDTCPYCASVAAGERDRHTATACMACNRRFIAAVLSEIRDGDDGHATLVLNSRARWLSLRHPAEWIQIRAMFLEAWRASEIAPRSQGQIGDPVTVWVDELSARGK